MTDMIERDPVDLLAGYRPTRAQLESEFGAARRAAVRAAVLTEPPSRGMRWRAVRPRRIASATVASAVAVAALIVGIVVALVPGGGTAKQSGGGAPFVPGTVVETPVVSADQFAYTATASYHVDGSGTAAAQGTYESWVAPDGSVWDRSSGHTNRIDNFCTHRQAPRQGDVETPTGPFFAELPTDPGALESYLRAHVSGSSSQDEALFVATGDMLRENGQLASSQLRAALVTVLAGISGITVHSGVTDYRGRPAVRVDWVNQALRAGELSSLYFDPSTYQLLEERAGPSGAPTSYNGPSPAYLAGESGASSTSEQLADPADVRVATEQSVVDSVPSDVQDCVAAGR